MSTFIVSVHNCVDIMSIKIIFKANTDQNLFRYDLGTIKIPFSVQEPDITIASTHQLSDIQGGSVFFHARDLHKKTPLIVVDKNFFFVPKSTNPSYKLTEFLAVEEWLNLNAGTCLGCSEHVVHLNGKDDVGDIVQWELWIRHRERCRGIERKITMAILREFTEIRKEANEKGEAGGYRRLRHCADPPALDGDCKKPGTERRASILKRLLSAGIKRKSADKKKILEDAN